ncbi:MAG: hypothetical protein CMM01_20155 [Rhodopirellula sp.]|nr:hypothetical protein [Rhodopirellula sp.]
MNIDSHSWQAPISRAESCLPSKTRSAIHHLVHLELHPCAAVTWEIEPGSEALQSSAFRF